MDEAQLGASVRGIQTRVARCKLPFREWSLRHWERIQLNRKAIINQMGVAGVGYAAALGMGANEHLALPVILTALAAEKMGTKPAEFILDQAPKLLHPSLRLDELAASITSAQEEFTKIAARHPEQAAEWLQQHPELGSALTPPPPGRRQDLAFDDDAWKEKLRAIGHRGGDLAHGITTRIESRLDF